MYVISQHMYHLNGSKVKDMFKSSAATEMFLISKQTLQEDIKTLTGHLARPAGVELFVLFIYRSLSLLPNVLFLSPFQLCEDLFEKINDHNNEEISYSVEVSNKHIMTPRYIPVTPFTRSPSVEMLCHLFSCVTSLLINSAMGLMGLFRACSLVQ